MFKKILLTLIVLIIVGLTVVYFARNILVKKAVESGGSYALGVQTDLSSARLNIGGGDLRLSHLDIHNPQGFQADNILSVDHSELTVQTGSVLDKQVVVDSLVIQGVRLNLEQIDAKGNYKVLLDHIKQFSSSSDTQSDRRIKIGLVALRDIKVSGSLSLLNKEYSKTYSVDNFELRNVGGNTGASTGQIIAKVVQAILTRSLAAGNGVLPPEFGKSVSELKDQGLKTLESKGKEELNQLGKSLLKGGH